MDLPSFLATHPVFALQEAVAELAPTKSQRAMVDRLKHHVKRGTIKKVSRGIYASVPPGLDPGKFMPDPFLVGNALRTDAVFSHHSALELLGVSHTVWNSITIFSARQRKALSSGGVKFSVLPNPPQLLAQGGALAGTNKVERRGILLTVAGPERTLVEGFRRPTLAGGTEELVNSAAVFPVLDITLLEKILMCYKTARVWAAAGWFLERFRREFHVPESFLATCERQKPGVPQYLERGSRGGTLVKRWNLILPNSISRAAEGYEP
jgi:predicted transcriptional regulator of viral defense system